VINRIWIIILEILHLYFFSSIERALSNFQKLLNQNTPSAVNILWRNNELSSNNNVIFFISVA